MNKVLQALFNEMQRIKAEVPDSRWFLFGSSTATKRPARDIDLLVVCKNAFDCVIIRRELDSICMQFPIHLMIMTESEESELTFIKGQKATEMASSTALAQKTSYYRD